MQVELATMSENPGGGGNPVAGPGQNHAQKKPPVALWIVAGAVLVLALAAWFVPMGSTKVYGVSLQCPTAAKSAEGVARVADMSRSPQFTQLAAKEMAKSCPQTAVALGVGILGTLAAAVMLVVALVLTVKRAGSHKPVNRGWVAPSSRFPGPA